MAYIGNYNNYAQAGRRPQTSADSNNKPNLGGSGGTVGGGAGAGNPSTPAATGGGGYTNLISYLGANQATGSTTGQGAANVVKQASNQALSDQAAFKASGNQAVDDAGAKIQPDQAVLDRIDGGGPGVDHNYINSQINTGRATSFDPYGYSGPSASDVAVNYQGPGSASDMSGQAGQDRARALASGAELAGRDANLKGQDGGIEALLSKAYAAPNYSEGERGLDSFLSRGTQGGRTALGEVGGLGGEAASNASIIDADLGNKIQGYRNQASNTNQQYADAIAKAQGRVDQTNKTYQDAFDKYKSRPDPGAADVSNVPPAITGGKIMDVYDAPGTLSTDKDYNDNTALPDGYDKPHIPGVQGGDSEYGSSGLPSSYDPGNSSNPTPPEVILGNNIRKILPDYSGMPKWGLAHGGRVPYSNLSSMLNKKKGC